MRQQNRQTVLSPDVYNTPEIKNRHSVMVTDGKYLNNNNNESQQNESRGGGGHSKKPSSDFRFIQESPSPSPE